VFAPKLTYLERLCEASFGGQPGETDTLEQDCEHCEDTMYHRARKKNRRWRRHFELTHFNVDVGRFLRLFKTSL